MKDLLPSSLKFQSRRYLVFYPLSLILHLMYYLVFHPSSFILYLLSLYLFPYGGFGFEGEESE